MKLLLITSCCFVFSAGLLAQGITFCGPVVKGNDPRSQATLQPMVGLTAVAIVESIASPATMSVVTGTTDAQGHFAVPPGYIVRQIQSSGLSSSRCRVQRPVNMGPLVWHVTPTLLMNDPPATVNVAQVPLPFPGSMGGNLSVEECSAFYHVHAIAELASQSLPAVLQGAFANNPITVRFETQPDPLGSPAVMFSGTAGHVLGLYPVPGVATAGVFGAHLAALSETVLAHEIGHAALWPYMPNSSSLREALCDYIAFSLTGMPDIGYGVLDPNAAIRDLRNYYAFDPMDPYHKRSQACSGALYAVSAPHGPIAVSVLQNMIATAVQVLVTQGVPTLNEHRLLEALLPIAPVPAAQALLCAFVHRSIWPWPATVPSTLSWQPCTFGPGFSNGSTAAPTLTPTYGTGSLQVDVDGAAPNSPVVLAVSALPTQFWIVPGLPPLLLDPTSLVTAVTSPTSSTGQLTVTMPVPLGLPPAVLNAFVLDAAGPLGLTATNGVYVGS